MAPEKQQPFDATQILNDITLVNQANKIEIEQIKEHLNLRISNAGLDGAIAETIIEEVTNRVESCIQRQSQGGEVNVVRTSQSRRFRGQESMAL